MISTEDRLKKEIEKLKDKIDDVLEKYKDEHLGRCDNCSERCFNLGTFDTGKDGLRLCGTCFQDFLAEQDEVNEKAKLQQHKETKQKILKLLDDIMPQLWNKYLRGDVGVFVWGKLKKELKTQIEKI